MRALCGLRAIPMAVEGTWRKELFEAGKEYRILKNWGNGEYSIPAGEIIEYDSCGYERYDCETLYRFYFNKGFFSRKKELIWVMHDVEPDTKAKEYFEEIQEKSAT